MAPVTPAMLQRPSEAELQGLSEPERLLARHGAHWTGASSAARESHPAIAKAYFQPHADWSERVAILELWFRPGTPRAEQSAAARCAFEALRPWFPDLDSWDVRARPGRELQGAASPKRRDDELDLLARERAKRLRGKP